MSLGDAARINCGLRRNIGVPANHVVFFVCTRLKFRVGRGYYPYENTDSRTGPGSGRSRRSRR
jgi:hypothetical protein